MNKATYRFLRILGALMLTLGNFYSVYAAPPSLPTSLTGRFVVQNGQILDPTGRPFIIKGATAVYGAFGGGDVKNYGTYDYDDRYHTYQSDLAEISHLGVNLIRLMVSVPGTAYYNSNYASYYGSEANYKAEIDKVVGWIRAEGMIAFIIPHHPTYSQETENFVAYLARTYKSDPYVWIGTGNEPDTCSNTSCWQNWHTWHDRYVRAIRAEGYVDPIIVNGVYWSGRLDHILEYPLHDNHGNVDLNLIYGAHRYGNSETDFETNHRAYCERYWAGLVENPNNPYAIIVDEYGNDNGGKGEISWLYGFQDYVTDWVLNRGGDGAIAFTWRWSDRNRLVDWQGFKRSEWGDIFVDRYLNIVYSSELTPVPPTAIPTNTPVSPTVTATPTASPIPPTPTATATVIIPTVTETLLPASPTVTATVILPTVTETPLPTSFTPTETLLPPTTSPQTDGTYYVSLSGSDQNNGSKLQPWRTIQKAVIEVPNGAVVVVQAGNYGEYISLKRSDISLIASGLVKMEGAYVGGERNRVEGFTIENPSNDAGIQVNGNNNVIKGNNILNTRHDGIRFFGTDNSFIENHIEIVMSASGRSNADCFQTWGPVDGAVFVENTCEHTSTSGSNQIVMLENQYSPVQNIEFRNNLFVMYDAGYSPMNFHRKNGQGEIKNIRVLNNTIVNMSGQGQYAVRMVDITSGVIKDNVIYGYDEAASIRGGSVSQSNNKVYSIEDYSSTTQSMTPVQPMPTATSTIVPPSATPILETTSIPVTFTPLPVTLTVTELVVQPTATETLMPVSPTPTEMQLPPTVTATESSLIPSPTYTEEVATASGAETMYDDKDKAFVYSAGWQDIKNKKAYAGSFKRTTRNEASVLFNFTGRSFSVLYKGGKAFGKMDVYVDGKFVGTINQQQKAAFQSRWDYPGQLAFGNHTLKLIFVTNKRAKDRVRGSLDAVIVH